MALPNIFSKEVSETLIQRINNLKPDNQAQWGKMNAAQMLAHCNVAYEMIYENKHPKPNFLMAFILRTIVKKKLTNEEPYKRSMQTAPAFIIKDDKNFGLEKNRLIQYINRTHELGGTYFHKKSSPSFGVMTKHEWNNMLYKHLDHHLNQFGV